MSSAEEKEEEGESKLTGLLLQKKVITEGQLKAALDYQRSLGGQIVDILVKLDLVRASQLEEFLGKMDAPEDTGIGEKRNVLDPAAVKISELKVHRRLLEKVPRDIVDDHLLVLFFPTAHVDSRKIILGHGREIGPGVEEKVRSIVGVDISTLELSERVARELLEEHHHGEPPARKAASKERAFRSSRPPGVPDEIVLTALINVLAKRGVITAEELQVETEHLEIPG